jgi:hypothetical protein
MSDLEKDVRDIADHKVEIIKGRSR